MKLEFTFNAFYYAYRDGIIKEAEGIGDELYIYIK